MLIVGLIGPIGAGKSVVARELASLGAAVIWADEISREVLVPGSATLKAVVEAFGEGILEADGALARRELGRIVFADAEARKTLESIVHPAMVARMRERLAELSTSQPPPSVVAIEAANLVQMGAVALADTVVMVTASPDERLRRVMARDGLTMCEAGGRMRVQEELGIDDYPADRTILAEGSAEATRAQAQRLWQELVEPKEGPPPQAGK